MYSILVVSSLYSSTAIAQHHVYLYSIVYQVYRNYKPWLLEWFVAANVCSSGTTAPEGNNKQEAASKNNNRKKMQERLLISCAILQQYAYPKKEKSTQK